MVTKIQTTHKLIDFGASRASQLYHLSQASLFEFVLCCPSRSSLCHILPLLTASPYHIAPSASRGARRIARHPASLVRTAEAIFACVHFHKSSKLHANSKLNMRIQITRLVPTHFWQQNYLLVRTTVV